jgi:hypothetical protein
MTTNFDTLVAEVMSDQYARTAAIENDLRRDVARQIQRLVPNIAVEELASRAQVPVAHVRRILHEDVGGTLPLTSLVRVADALNLRVHITLQYRVLAHEKA